MIEGSAALERKVGEFFRLPDLGFPNTSHDVDNFYLISTMHAPSEYPVLVDQTLLTSALDESVTAHSAMIFHNLHISSLIFCNGATRHASLSRKDGSSGQYS